MRNEDVAVVIPSCDKFQDLWEPFYSFFFKYWPDCPYKVYHGSNFLRYENPRVTSLTSNININWSTELKTVLGQIKEKYIILILEDYFIYKQVDNKKLQAALDVAEKENALALRTACWPSTYFNIWPYDALPNFPFAGKIRQDAKYRICTQISIWNKELFMSLLKEGESIWQFEIEGSERTKSYKEPCLCLTETADNNFTGGPIPYLCTAVSKGIWMRDALKLCRKENITVKSDRPMETRLEYSIRYIYTRSPLFLRKYIDFIKYRILKVRF